MLVNLWEGKKVRLRAVVPEDWEKFHENDQDSEIARASDAIYFPRSEAGAYETSQRLHEHLGFQLEGTLRNIIYTNGQHYDEYIYGLLKSEFVR
ncbi:GNAT family N-acetyltransferase [Brevibacillus porteri]|uniref:GNAT family N-acetyltransferase n=1 Tax=Brevibacillus porteri TaxID=2126350 RepID=UPI00362DA935